MTGFAQRVGTRRKELALSNARLAGAAGISRAALSTIEQGHLPSPKTTVKLARALGLNPYELLLLRAVDELYRALAAEGLIERDHRGGGP